jgi:hypothetical protein
MKAASIDELPAIQATKPLVGRRFKPIGLNDNYTCESMGSWLLRIARCNGFDSVGSLLQKTGYYNVHLDIPRFPHRYLPTMEVGTGRPLDEIRQMLLGKTGVNAERDFSVRLWVLSAKDQRNQERDGMRHVVCVRCLQEDTRPYWRKYWRFSFSTVCRVHKTLLQEICGRCSSYFVIDARSNGSARICETCHETFANFSTHAQQHQVGSVEAMLSRVFVAGDDTELLEGADRHYQRLNLARLVDLLSSLPSSAVEDPRTAASWAPPTGFRGGLMQFFPKLCIHERHRVLEDLGSVLARSPVVVWQLLNFEATWAAWLKLAKLLLIAPAPMRWGQPLDENHS